ncbi:MAG: hypothetical protein ACO1PM_16725 [Acidovorax sp.]
MQLTEQEQKMVSHLRKQHNGWRTNRVVIVVAAVIMLGQGIRLVWSGQSDLGILYCALSFGFFSYTLGSWTGRPELSLLLRLIEEKGQASKTPPSSGAQDQG